MVCFNPLQVYPFNKGEKVKFKKYRSVDVAKYDMNVNYESNNSVPCRKCEGCKLDNAKEWAIRSALECKSSENNWFITLTYSNEFVPVGSCLISTREEIYTCRYSHLRTFVESLRKVFTRRGIKDIKYLASSEYGSRTNRPHYHLCFFGLPLDDLELTGERSDLGHPYFVSKLVDKIWGKGIHKIGRVTYESAGYTARYTTKKMKNLDYKKLGIEPEKLFMSKGIGKKYFEENKEHIYKYDVINLNTDKGLVRLQPPRYFDRLYEKQNAQHLQEIKNARIVNAKHNLVSRVHSSGIGYVNLLESKKYILRQKIKALKRNVKNKK